MIICVSGTPGTGKTTLAKKLAKDFGLKYISGNSIITKYKLSEGYDKARRCRIVDKKRFSAAVLKEYNKFNNMNIIIDSHLSHFLPSSKVKACIICRCSLKNIEKRLKKRRYSKAKIRDNLDCEIFELIANEAAEKGHKIVFHDSNLSKNYSKTKKAFKNLVVMGH